MSDLRATVLSGVFVKQTVFGFEGVHLVYHWSGSGAEQVDWMTWTAPQGIVTSSIEKIFHQTRGADHDRYGKLNTCIHKSRPISTGHGLPALIKKTSPAMLPMVRPGFIRRRIGLLAESRMTNLVLCHYARARVDASDAFVGAPKSAAS